MHDSKGIFITFEGGEGSGKSTQVKLLAESLRENGHDVIVTREPGGTPESEKIRDLLVQSGGGDWNGMEQCLLFFAARSHLVRTIIRPGLKQGKIVICDRFTDSTRAYQGYGFEMDLNIIETLHKTVLDAFEPHLTILLDIPAEEGLKRSVKRLENQDSNEDKFENMNKYFHEKLRHGFLSLAKAHKERFCVIDARLPIQGIADQVFEKVSERLL